MKQQIITQYEGGTRPFEQTSAARSGGGRLSSARRPVITSLFLLALATASPAMDLQITKAYTSHSVSGSMVPYIPKIGEVAYVTVEWKVTGTAAAAYKIKVTIAGLNYTNNWTDLTAGDKKVNVCWFKLPLDGAIPITAVIDPEHKSGAGYLTWFQNKLNTSFTPVAPAGGVEYFEPQECNGGQTCSVTMPGFMNRFQMMVCCPSSDSYQTVNSAVCQMVQPGSDVWLNPVSANDASVPVWFHDRLNAPAGTYITMAAFNLTLRNTRVNMNTLRQVTWSDVDWLPAITVFNHYLQAEPIVEKNDPAIANYIVNNLGANYRAYYTPYDAARKMFQAVLRDITYYYAADRPDTALKVLQQHRGDCGGFSLLLTAIFRKMGLPCRNVCGLWINNGGSHCWNEFWMPGCGWVHMDGSGGNSYSEDGQYAFCFGNATSLNARSAMLRGNVNVVSGRSAPWPSRWWTAPNIFGGCNQTDSLTPVP